MNGYIKLYRQLTEWEWYKEPNTKAVFLHLLIMANHAPGRWQGIDIDRGQHLTSIKKLAEETGLSERNVRTALNHLKSTNEVTSKTTSRWTLITVENYEKYQGDAPEGDKVSDKVSDKQVTKYRQSPDKVLTTNNNNKKNKKETEGIRIHNNAFLKAAEESPEEKVLTFSDGESRRYRGGIYMMDEEESKRVMDANHQAFLQAVAEGRLKDPRRM